MSKGDKPSILLGTSLMLLTDKSYKAATPGDVENNLLTSLFILVNVS